ncbi:hypothetical protein C8R44DRAFT_984737, partial [Mycena epipterygia]
MVGDTRGNECTWRPMDVENGDEKWAEALSRRHKAYPLLCPTSDLVDAFRRLEVCTRKPRPSAQKVLVHLSPLARVAIISWFIVAGPLRQSKFRSGHHRIRNLATLLGEWGTLFHSGSRANDDCPLCRVSSVLRTWAETVLHVYSVEDLMAIPWPCRCNCLQRGLAATSVEPQMPLEKDSVAFRILHQLVC